MAMADWTDKINGINMTLSSTYVYEGSKSLRICCKTGARVIKTLDKSETDSPKHANVEFYYYNPVSGGNYRHLSIFFRLEDISNFYMLNIGTRYARFGYSEGGVATWGDWSNWINTLGQWISWKVMFCEMGGIVYCELYKNDVLVYEQGLTAKFLSGGAVGVGADSFVGACQSDSFVYLDTTKIYY